MWSNESGPSNLFFERLLVNSSEAQTYCKGLNFFMKVVFSNLLLILVTL